MATIDHVRHHHTRHGIPIEGPRSGAGAGGGGGDRAGPVYGGTNSGMSAPVDPVRQSRARREVKGERDRLVKAGDHKIGAQQAKEDLDIRRQHAKILVATIGLTITTLVPYAVMLVSWFFLYHSNFVATVGFFILFVVMAGCCVVASHPRATGRDRPWLWWLGVLFVFSTVVATILGFFLYFRSLAYYHKYIEMRVYTNVAAAQDAAAFSDGSMFLWTEDTRLDAQRSVGFRSRWTGQTYCVAPIVDASMAPSDEISYWAVGLNCCSSRAEFHCGSASDLATRSSLVVLEPEDVVRPQMQWAVLEPHYSQYMEAIALEEASYYTKAARRPKLLYWSKDPAGLQNSFYDGPSRFARIFSIVYCVAILVVCYLVAFRLYSVPRDRTYLFRANV